MTSVMDLTLDKDRLSKKDEYGRLPNIGMTGIYVRAKDDRGKWVSEDIVFLDKESLLTWIGNDIELAKKLISLLLGHGR